MTPISSTTAASDPVATLGTRPTLPLPPVRSGLDPTGGTAPSDNEGQNDQFVQTSIVNRAAAIEGPKPAETEPGPAMDESIWKFVVETPQTQTPASGPSVPESSDASGWKASQKPVAGPAVPDVHPAEKLVDGNTVDTPIAAPQPGGEALVDVVLERSNVDIAHQFMQMMLARRAYQADSAGITVSNELLLDPLNVKR